MSPKHVVFKKVSRDKSVSSPAELAVVVVQHKQSCGRSQLSGFTVTVTREVRTSLCVSAGRLHGPERLRGSL